MRTASSAIRTCNASWSASENTATVRTPSRRQVRMIRQAISPRLAMSTDSSIACRPWLGVLDEGPAAQLGHRRLELGLGVHNNRPMPGDRFLERTPGDE